MFLSIVIPIWNDEKYLEECLDSCLNQDLSEDEYEIICVDDGSTDRTPEILRSYAARYSNIRLLMMERHKGGRTVGYSYAQGDYVWFVDHDDLIAPNSLKELKEYTETNPSADCICFSYYQFYEQFTEQERILFEQCRLNANDNDRNHNAVVWDGIFKRSFLLEHDILPYSKRISDAGKYWGKDVFPVFSNDSIFMDECNENHLQTVKRTGNALYYYRISKSSQTGIRTPDALLDREQKKYNTLLYYIYVAILYKERYGLERLENGVASQETAINLIVRLRGIAKILAFKGKTYYKQAIIIFREKELFFLKKPPEYHFSLFDYLRMRGGLDRFKPFSIAEYYSYTLCGVRLMRFMKTFWRIRERTSGWHKLKYLLRKRSHQLNPKRNDSVKRDSVVTKLK